MPKKSHITRKRFSRLYSYRDFKYFYDLLAELIAAILERATGLDGIKEMLNHGPKTKTEKNRGINRYDLIQAFPPEKVIALLEASQNQQDFTYKTVVAARSLSCEMLKDVFNSQDLRKAHTIAFTFIKKLPTPKTIFTGFSEAMYLYDKQKGWFRRLFGPSKAMRLIKKASKIYQKFYYTGRNLKKHCLASKLIINNKSGYDPRFKLVCNTIRYLIYKSLPKAGSASHRALCLLIIAATKTLEIQGTNDYSSANRAIKSLRSFYEVTRTPAASRCSIDEIKSILSNVSR